MKMLKKHRSVKKFLALFLAFALLITMTPNVYAEDTEETNIAETVESEEGTESIDSTELENETSVDAEEIMPQSDAQDEEVSQQEVEIKDENETTSQEEPQDTEVEVEETLDIASEESQENDEKETDEGMKAENLSEQSQEEKEVVDEGTAELSEDAEDEMNETVQQESEETSDVQEENIEDGIMTVAADITPPVISDFVFVENGQEVEDKYIHFTFKAQDADGSAISESDSHIWISGSGDTRGGIPSITDNGDGTYTAKWYVGSLKAGTYQIYKFEIADIAGNVAYVPVQNDDLSYMYTFIIPEKDVDDSINTYTSTYTITDVRFDVSEIVFDNDNSSQVVNVTMQVEEDLTNTGTYIEMLSLYMVHADEKFFISCRYDKENNTFTGEGTVYCLPSGTYKIEGVNATTTAVNVVLNCETSIEIKNNVTDVTGPVLEEFYFTKNGEKVENGFKANTTDEVKAYFSFDEELSTILNKYVSFSTGLSNISSTSHSCSLTWNETMGMYEAALKIDNWYPTEWKISYFSVYDRFGNHTGTSSNLRSNVFYLEKDGTCVLPTYSKYVYVYTGTDSEFEYKNVNLMGSITSLNELFSGDIPEPKQYEGVNFVGWSYSMGYGGEYQLIQPDEKFSVSSGDRINIKPIYDKVPVTLELCYVHSDGNKWHEDVTLMLEEGMTYGELYEMYKNYEVEHVSGLQFMGWEHREDLDLNEVVSYYDRMNLDAQYSNAYLEVWVDYCNENNEYTSVERTFILEAGITTEDFLKTADFGITHSADSNFIGWDFDEDWFGSTIESGYNYLEISAEYQKYPISYAYTYMATDGSTKEVTVNAILEQGTTLNDIINSIVLPGDAAPSTVDGWVVNKYWVDYEVGYSLKEFAVAKKYEGYLPIAIDLEHVNSKLEYVDTWHFYYLEDTYSADGITENELDTISEMIPDIVGKLSWDMHEDFQIKEITNYCSEGYDIEDSVNSRAYIFYAYAKTDKVLAVFSYPDGTEERVALEKESVYQLPSTYRGYEVKWVGYDVDECYEEIEIDSELKFTVEKYWQTIELEATFVDENVKLDPPVDGDTSDGTPSTPNVPNTPTTPTPDNGTTDNVPDNTPNAPTTPSKPSNKPENGDTKNEPVTLPSSVIEEKVNAITEAEKGSSIVIDMKNPDGTVATVVPVEVLETARGKDVNVVLDMGGYSWTINGMDIMDIDLKAINLEVTMDTNAVAPSVVNMLANGEPTRQLSLTHNGDFGFKASLTLNVGSEYEGQYGNLYYHDSTGKLVFMNAGEIDANGNVTLDFSHASDYVLVMGRDRTEEETENPSVPETPQEDTDKTKTDVTSPKTSTSTFEHGMFAMMAILTVIIAAAGIALVIRKKSEIK